MRKRLAKLPSPAMAVAFVALLAAGQVKTQDIRNSTVRGRDVRTGTLTGSDINEGSLGLVPSANTANSAGSASTAGFAGSAGAVTGRTVTGQARQADGGADVTLVSAAGFRIYAHCDIGDLGAEVRVENTSTGGDSAHVMSDWVGDLNSPGTIDEDDVAAGAFVTVVGSNDADDSSIAQFSAHGENGAVLHGQAMATDTPDGNFPATTDCATSVTVDFR
ncbi:MAG: hypothetical protein LC808_29125 [Actinobacteria bacterium]|nr:hypothetical protein [Actinomycetota bacterium]